MQVIQFIFQNFWHFSGTVILLCCAIAGIAAVFAGITDVILVARARR